MASKQEQAMTVVNERAQMWKIWNRLRIGLGILWIIDGFLQLKPPMFTSAFVHQDLAANLAGQSLFVQGIIHYGMGLWSVNDVAAAVLAALIKFGLGTLLLLPNRYYQRIGIVHTVVWGLVTWALGEGFGMMLMPSMASFATGAPGSVFYYILIAVLLLFNPGHWYQRLRWVIGLLWLWALLNQVVILVKVPTTPTLTGIAIVSNHPIAVNALLVLLMAAFLASWIIGWITRPVILAAMALWLIFWALGMQFGWGALSTDPNSGPLWGLLLWAQYLALPQQAQVPSRRISMTTSA